MNTPSHSIINLAVLLPLEPSAALPIFLGSVLPDLPMLVLYGWAKGVKRQPELQIWGETYWQPLWQILTHGFHSIPLALAGAGLAYQLNQVPLGLLCLSAVLHSLGDLPVHHDDAHRHFLPLTNYRFISPLSYWDRRYHAKWVSLGERLLVALTTMILMTQFFEALWVRGLLLAINGLYWSSYCYRFFARGCEQATQKSATIR